MSSEQNVPEVQMHQGPPPRTWHHAGGQMDQNGPAHEGRRTAFRTAWASPRAAADVGASGRTSRRTQGRQAQGGSQGGLRETSRRARRPRLRVRCSRRTSRPAAASSRRAAIHQALEEEVSRPRPSALAGEPRQPGQRGSSNGGAGYRDNNTHQPGNSAGGFKRKGKQQRGPRSFVGPMDHSYRAVNGNFAETPPSTIESHGNYQPRRRRRDAAM